MNSIVLKSEELNLPEEVAKKLKDKEVEFIEVKEGILLRPVFDPIKEAKGFLKDRQFSTQRYFQMKNEEKGLIRLPKMLRSDPAFLS